MKGQKEPVMSTDLFSDYTMTIDGKSATSSDSLETFNPATEEVIARVPDASREQLEQAVTVARRAFLAWRSEEHTSELQSLMRISYAVFCLKKNKPKIGNTKNVNTLIHVELE